MKDLLLKYDQPVPRYASYPTAKNWSRDFTAGTWREHLKADLKAKYGLYIHIPFCQSLCGFCGLNTSITENREVRREYVKNLLQEWEMYSPDLGLVSSIYLGGGTPNFLCPDTNEMLLGAFEKAEDFWGLVEVDPRYLNLEILESYKDLGFENLSMGIQDFNESVLKKIGRFKDSDKVESSIDLAKKMGFHLSFDLLYGLPGQTEESWQINLQKLEELSPQRLALYRWVPVPWTKPEQRPYKDEEIPERGEAIGHYEMIREKLKNLGYVDLGMDYYAKEGDILLGQRHRYFSGYNPHDLDAVIGLGVSAISETKTAYHQNEKALPVYQRRVSQGELPTYRGLSLNDTEIEKRQRISSLTESFTFEKGNEDLTSFIEDGLVEVNDQVYVQEKGLPFLRHIAKCLEEA